MMEPMNTTAIVIKNSRANSVGCVERSETHLPALMKTVRFAKALNTPYETSASGYL
jgi:hypothetical protein